jgi:preprotein translocase subunit SecE
VATKTSSKQTSKKKKQSGIARWWRETTGELRKVVWPTPPDALQLTKIVVIVIFLMSALLGILDFVFSKIVTLVLA